MEPFRLGNEQRLPQDEALTDEQAVDRVLDGDVAFFEILMRRNNVRVYRTVRSLIKDEAEIEDTMQASYLLAYSKLHSFRREAKFSTWLTQIALNEALVRIRRDTRHPFVSLSVVENSAMTATASPPPTPEAHASRREIAYLLERAVDALPDLYRVVFVMREVEGMSTAETAQSLTVSEEVVKTRLSRARAILKDSLEKLVGSAVGDAFTFHASRCDRVVANVMQRLATEPKP
jgi:RNA polymerase sigma-70 factor (ECF subfamily)